VDYEDLERRLRRYAEREARLAQRAGALMARRALLGREAVATDVPPPDTLDPDRWRRVLSAWADSLEARFELLSEWERGVEQWGALIERGGPPDVPREVAPRLKARLMAALSEELRELGEGELDQIVSRALGDTRTHDTPTIAPALRDALDGADPEGSPVEQEAQLLADWPTDSVLGPLDADDAETARGSSDAEHRPQASDVPPPRPAGEEPRGSHAPESESPALLTSADARTTVAIPTPHLEGPRRVTGPVPEEVLEALGMRDAQDRSGPAPAGDPKDPATEASITEEYDAVDVPDSLPGELADLRSSEIPGIFPQEPRSVPDFDAAALVAAVEAGAREEAERDSQGDGLDDAGFPPIDPVPHTIDVDADPLLGLTGAFDEIDDAPGSSEAEEPGSGEDEDPNWSQVPTDSELGRAVDDALDPWSSVMDSGEDPSAAHDAAEVGGAAAAEPEPPGPERTAAHAVLAPEGSAEGSIDFESFVAVEPGEYPISASSPDRAAPAVDDPGGLSEAVEDADMEALLAGFPPLDSVTDEADQLDSAWGELDGGEAGAAAPDDSDEVDPWADALVEPAPEGEEEDFESAWGDLIDEVDAETADDAHGDPFAELAAEIADAGTPEPIPGYDATPDPIPGYDATPDEGTDSGELAPIPGYDFDSDPAPEPARSDRGPSYRTSLGKIEVVAVDDGAEEDYASRLGALQAQPPVSQKARAAATFAAVAQASGPVAPADPWDQLDIRDLRHTGHPGPLPQTSAAPHAEPDDSVSSVARPVERRRPARVNLAVKVGLEHGNNFFTGFSGNISEGGLFVATHQLLPIGSTVDLFFEMPDGYPVQVEGKVRWVREYNPLAEDVPPGLGVSFDDLDGEARIVVERYVAQHETLFFD
jgi:uncharacterized protein (TIGR02266 family)